MAPPRLQNNAAKPSQVSNLLRSSGVTTRNKSAQLCHVEKPPLPITKDLRGKRKAEVSPLKNVNVKRSALGNITNALTKSAIPQLQVADKKKGVKKVVQPTILKSLQKQNESGVHAKNTLEVLNKITEGKGDVMVQPKLKPILRIKQIKEEEKKIIPSKTATTRQSVDFEKSDDSLLYVSALEDVSEEVSSVVSKDEKKENVCVDDIPCLSEKDKVTDDKVERENDEEVKKNEDDLPVEEKLRRNLPPVRKLPKGVGWDFDVENWQDPYQVSTYAQEIFEYLKERESMFVIGDYMEKQVCLSKWMRSLLVDWMVEVQESFELNHETLYLAVKLVDLYLTKVAVGKETLQLLGAASLFIASKYDERIPPMVEDFLYICDGAYSQRELIRMEINVLKVMDFDLGVPLSYRFLRRYARCAKITMPTLTLARYILEYSLMDYATIRYSDSKMAAAALFLALYMKDVTTEWTPTLEHYTGYKMSDIKEIVMILNEGLHKKPKESLSTVRKKYSHKIFFEVAKVPLREIKDL